MINRTWMKSGEVFSGGYAGMWARRDGGLRLKRGDGA